MFEPKPASASTLSPAQSASSVDVAHLRSRFVGLCERLGTTVDAGAAFDALVVRYDEPQRRVHTLARVTELLARLDEATDCDDPDLVEAALFFCEAVFDPRRQDNETRSASLAVRTLAGLPRERAQRLRALIHFTRDPLPTEDRDLALVHDVVLAVFGLADAAYAQYEALMRAEYGWIAEAPYRMGRSRVLAAYLAREPLYLTAHFAATLEAQARANLHRTLSSYGHAIRIVATAADGS